MRRAASPPRSKSAIPAALRGETNGIPDGRINTSPEPGVSSLGVTLRGIVIYCGLLPTCGLSAGDGLAAGEAVLAESSDFLYLGSLT